MKPASEIHLFERDYFLKLESSEWPPADLEIINRLSQAESEKKWHLGKKDKKVWLAEPWERPDGEDSSGYYLWRQLQLKSQEELHKPENVPKLYETLIRFPSAPLFGIQRKHDYQFRMKPIHQHTFRLLTAEHPGTSRIDQIFLFFNGLNEIEHLGFYYDLAGLLITPEGEARTGVACIIHPYPGHLTRYPMIGRYAEKPLQRFITDPSDLFRQYLRFMVEIQWLLSVLVAVSYYPVTPGIGLLAEDMDPSRGRCDTDCLSKAIVSNWKAIYDSSSKLVEDTVKDAKLKELRNSGGEISEHGVRQSIETIRQLIRWEPSKESLAKLAERQPKNGLAKDLLPAPRIHVIGYSLGGYLAQSAFFTWPFALSSCTTLCSGAALHDLRPTKIVHEEEWRSITHGLKYEIESGMLEQRLRIDYAKGMPGRSVCGIPASYFSSHFQIFNDVFLRDPHGSYRPRVSEFSPRLLFVVGGNDPIVSTRSVLEASPPEGINMIEIANLSHFIAIEGGEWPSFWLPTVASVVSSLAKHSEKLSATSVLSNLWNEETTDAAWGTWLKEESGQSKVPLNRREPDPLDSKRMQEALVELVDPLNKGAFLFIFRNQVPFTLMGKRLLYRRGSVPHYEDFQIRIFWQQLQKKRETMLSCKDRITLVLPGRLNEWFGQQPSILSVKSLPLARELPDRDWDCLKDIWEDFLSDWEHTGALYRFDPERPARVTADRFPLEHMLRKDTSTPEEPELHPVLNCLPDLWIGLSHEVVEDIAGGVDRDGIHEGFLDHVLDVYRQRNGRETYRKQAIEKTRKWLTKGGLSIVRISTAQSNARFLGERIWNHESVIDMLVHSALALARSLPCKEKGDFKKNWLK